MVARIDSTDVASRLLQELQAHPQHGVQWRVHALPDGKPAPSDHTVLLVTPEQLQGGMLSPIGRCRVMRYAGCGLETLATMAMP